MNSIINWDPFREIDEMQDRISRILGGNMGSGIRTVTPATDIYEEDGKLILETALPKFKEEDVEFNLNQDRLGIKAEHKEESEDKNRNYLRRESSQVSYDHQFALPKDVDADSADAGFENGTLKVIFDRKELPLPKRLSLKSDKAIK